MDTAAQRHFRDVLGKYPTGVVVVTATIDGAPVGMTVGSFGSASLDPPLVTFLPRRDSATWEQIRRAGRFCVNVLGSDQEHLCRQLSRASADRFAGVGYRLTPLGSPLLDGVTAYVDCTVEDVHPAGDHDIVVGAVRELDVLNSGTPLLFYGGGYGAFTSMSRVAAEASLLEVLPRVDLIRPAMESLASKLGREVIAVARQGRELVFVAAAGGADRTERVTRLGHRVPYLPPVGGVFAAYGGEESLTQWIGELGETTEGDRMAIDAMAERIRRRGHVLALGHDKSTRLEELSAALPPHADAHASEELRTLTHSLEDDYNPAGTPDRADGVELHYASAPVFGAGDDVAFALTVYGPAGRCSPVERDELTTQLMAAADTASRALQRTPAVVGVLSP